MKFINLNREKELTKEKFEVVRNGDQLIKPYGGLWASPLYDDNKTEWDDFVNNELNDKKYDNRIEFTIKEDSKIFIIDCKNDLLSLLELFKLENEFNNSLYVAIDFEKMAKEYDGILLTSDGQYSTRLSSPSLYGWDVASLLIFNFEIIENQRLT